MTAIMPERPDVDLNALRRDLVAVLAIHGLTGLDTVSVAVTEIEQGGAFAGVAISGMVYQRPGHLPAPEKTPERQQFGEEERELFERGLDMLNAVAGRGGQW